MQFSFPGWLNPKIVQKRFRTHKDKYALDQIHDSWSLLWGFPKSRTVANNSLVSNSVAIRGEYENSYQPENLTLNGGAQVATYQTVQVVTQPPL
jgi:hypothetical protein